MESAEIVLSPAEPRACRWKTIRMPVPLFRLCRRFNSLLMLCILFTSCCRCRPVSRSVAQGPTAASSVFFCSFGLTSITDIFLEVAARKLVVKLNPGARGSAGDSKERKSAGAAPCRVAGMEAHRVPKGDREEEQQGEGLKAAAGAVYVTEKTRSTEAQSRLTSAKGKPHSWRVNQEEERKKRGSIAKEMKDLLSDNLSWRLLQAKRRAHEELKKYADEEGQLAVENLDAWQAENAAYQKHKKGITAAEIGAAASGAVGAAGIVGFLYGRKQKIVGETLAKRRSLWGLGAAGVLGLLGVALAAHNRRLLKKKKQLSERRLVRMENEAYAGIIPTFTPVLGVDEFSEEELRKGKKQEQQRQQQQQ